jgi:(1->4)-alpha-D-glucan 1-alpha-D-glucosylmutase
MNNANGEPMATYRLQMNQDFGFNDARSLVPYFSRLGITHVYTSPILRARQSSTHGYDVVDPKTINPNLGDEKDLIDLVTDLRRFDLGLVVDLVPNHLATSIENPYWRDVLTYGHSSPFANWFDIDWRMPDPDMWGRVLVPVLGAPRSRILSQDQIQLAWSDGRFLVKYFDHVFPVDPATVPMICEFGLPELQQLLADDQPVLEKIFQTLGQLKELPRVATRLRRHVDIDREQTEQLLAHFARLVMQSPRSEKWVENTAEHFGQGPNGRRRLKKLLDNQPYRLVYWRAAARTINYRRFFDINELISVRQEDPRVFEETHATPLRWVEQGLVDGLRIDHIDGLRDPLGYLERLAEEVANVAASGRRVPVFVEKILAPDEKLPCGWPVAGTTGYEMLNQLEAVFVSGEGFATIEAEYRRMLRRPVRFQDVASWGKRRVLRGDLAPQVGRLADTLLQLAEGSGHHAAGAAERREAAVGERAQGDRRIAMASSGDAPLAAGEPRTLTTVADSPQLTKRDYVDAIIEVATALPIYRTYVDGNHRTLNDDDRRYVQIALHQARGAGRAASEAVDFLGEVLLLDKRTGLPERVLHQQVNFIQRFQQLTGPAAAKGIEDTAFYAYVPLVSLNEVGGEPHLPADPVARLHQANEERAATWPYTMLCTTTHDTKRTADVRARLDVLSELPRLWSGLIRRWHRLSRSHRSRVRGKLVPDPATAYLFFQTAVGIWPLPDPGEPQRLPAPEVISQLRERIAQYMLKAAREAKTHTSWTSSDQQYEDALETFVNSLLPDEGDDRALLLTDVQALVARIARPGLWNSLARTVIHFTAPGTPDLYQGDELWNFALVDPDNRRPVDYQQRRQLLDEVITGVEAAPEARREFLDGLLESSEDGRIKLYVIHAALTARRNYPGLFASGRYLPLQSSGSACQHLVAYARVPTSDDVNQDAATIVVVPRLTTTLVSPPQPPTGAEVWSDTVVHLPPALRDRRWTCSLTREAVPLHDGHQLRVANMLGSFPVALLVGSGARTQL